MDTSSNGTFINGQKVGKWAFMLCFDVKTFCCQSWISKRNLVFSNVNYEFFFSLGQLKVKLKTKMWRTSLYSTSNPILNFILNLSKLCQWNECKCNDCKIYMHLSLLRLIIFVHLFFRQREQTGAEQQ